MKLHRFYIPQTDLPTGALLEKGREITLTHQSFVHQVGTVLKLHTGENIIVFCGDTKEYVSSIVSIDRKTGVTIRIQEMHDNTSAPSKNLYLFFTLLKKDNTDWVLQKGTELGVSHFIPVISARTERKDINMERSNKILIEATEQSGRPIPPVLHDIMKLKDVFLDTNLTFPLYGCDGSYGNSSLVDETAKNNSQSLGVIIGPEGGWTEDEIDMFREKGVKLCTLGTTTLRAETAAIVAITLARL